MVKFLKEYKNFLILGSFAGMLAVQLWYSFTLTEVRNKYAKYKYNTEKNGFNKEEHIKAKFKDLAWTKTLGFAPQFGESFSFMVTGEEKWIPIYYGILIIGNRYRWIRIHKSAYYKMRKIIMVAIKKNDDSFAKMQKAERGSRRWQRTGSWQWVTNDVSGELRGKGNVKKNK